MDCAELALTIRGMLAGAGLETFVKTSGSKGMQLYLPVNTPTDYETTKTFAHRLARMLEKEKPNVEKGAPGPFYAEFDVKAAAAGAYQLDMLEEETGAGTCDVWVNGVLEQRGKGAVQNRKASPDAGGGP